MPPPPPVEAPPAEVSPPDALVEELGAPPAFEPDVAEAPFELVFTSLPQPNIPRTSSPPATAEKQVGEGMPRSIRVIPAP
jgi:hypothetical protein